ncbi:MAG: DUF1917 domain-containing protein [Euryarchaeota archaeon]|nr:DUF1917 domain-containing protein [Euryarchaeota archaeon]MDE1836859.1 DUF1917 domain-containing protein [Euryarchaeota archaeon]MDE1879738.1 DUF1917 domain-containing protein [Euryarchaeota archaeon]MDE2046039.1 DUF1917 domain-containing protein [Thermoplasmata archaeon]
MSGQEPPHIRLVERIPLKISPLDPETQPSTCRSSPWIRALIEDGKAPREDRKFSGKWLLFVLRETVDRVWEEIDSKTAEGRLGCQSKVSTVRRDPAQVIYDEGKHVICVFTYDCRDPEDVRRVRERLRELGFREKIAYKTNAATRAGLYGDPSDLRVHLLYE